MHSTWYQLIVTMNVSFAGNGTPVFTLPATRLEYSRLFGATLDSARQLWLYPAFYPLASRVLADLRTVAPGVQLSEKAQAWADRVAQMETDLENRRLPADFTFVTKPYDHQLLGLAHLFYLPRAALYFDRGLGKSKILTDYIRLLKHLRLPHVTLCLAPKVTVRNMGKEIDIHSGKKLRWIAILGDKAQKLRLIAQAAAGGYDVVLVTYGTAARMAEELDRIPYSVIAADEAQRIKEWSANQTRAAYNLAQKAYRRVILTGTATLGDPEDLYGPFRFLATYLIPETRQQFRTRYVETSPFNEHKVVGYKNLDVLNGRVAALACRRTKEQCLDLPPRVIRDVTFDLSRGQVEAYDRLILEMGLNVTDAERLLEGIGVASREGDILMANVGVLLNKLSQIRSGFLLVPADGVALCRTCQYRRSCEAADIRPYTKACQVATRPPTPSLTTFKENPAIEVLRELLEAQLAMPGRKAIVWCRYTFPGTELDAVENLVKELGVGYVRVDGDTGDATQDCVDRFQQDPLTRIYIGQISTGIGITLTAADYMVYYSVDCSLESYLQSLDRNYRIGQQQAVRVDRLVGAGTLDSAVFGLLDHKIDVDAMLTIPGRAGRDLVKRDGLRAAIINKEGT